MNEDDHLNRLRALAHPARLQILSLLTGTALSAAEVARELGTTQANASYHLRRLAAVGEVELAEEVTIRGGHARRYRCPPVAGEPEEVISGAAHDVGGPEERLYYATLAQELQRRARGRRRDGRMVTADAELWVSPRVWDAARARLVEVVNDLHERAVPPRVPGAIRISITLALFDMDPAARPVAPEDEDEEQDR